MNNLQQTWHWIGVHIWLFECDTSDKQQRTSSDKQKQQLKANSEMCDEHWWLDTPKSSLFIATTLPLSNNQCQQLKSQQQQQQ